MFKSINSYYYYLILDAILYANLIILFIYFTIWITGLKYWIFYVINLISRIWLDVIFIGMVLLIIGGTGFIFKELLNLIEQKIFLLQEDRRVLIQQNMDLNNENKQIQQFLKKILTNKDEDDLINIINNKIKK